jgi:hypothetical protein
MNPLGLRNRQQQTNKQWETLLGCNLAQQKARICGSFAIAYKGILTCDFSYNLWFLLSKSVSSNQAT